MSVPLLQIALDNTTLSEALKSVKTVGKEIDIIEAGTILCLAEGMESVKCLRALYPDKIILADTKCADAGRTVSKMCADAGADWMTMICSATIPTIKAALKEIKELQVELYGNWTFENAKRWKEAGITQVVYHQSRDALLSGETWSDNDLNKIKKLTEIGFKVSITGGLEIDTLKLFKDINIFAFIVGRSIRDSKNPDKEVKKFKEQISKYWI